MRIIDSIKIALFKEILKKEEHLGLTIVGMSMLPTLWPGDSVTVTHCSLEEIHPNDIVILKKNGSMITHRVYKIIKNKTMPDLSVIYTKGDNNPAPDPPSTMSSVIAKVIGYKKKSFYHFIPRFLLKWIVRFVFYKRLMALKNKSFFFSNGKTTRLNEEAGRIRTDRS